MGSWSNLRRLHVAVCVAGLGFYVVGFSQQLGQSSLPPDLRLDALSYPVTLGGLEARGPEELRFLGEGWPVGTRLDLRDAGGHLRQVELVARRDGTYLTLAAFSALFFWAMCLFAFIPRLQVPGALYSFWASFPYGLAIAIGGIYFRGARPAIWSVTGYIHLLCLAALPVVFVAMTSAFPRRHPVRDRLPWLLPLLIALAAGVVAWQLWAFETYFRNPVPALAGRLALAGRVADFVLVGQVVLGVTFLFQQRGLATQPRERDQVQWLYRGFLVGVTPYVFLRTLPVALGLPALLPAGVDRLFELAIPITFLLAVARHQLFEIDLILRRGLIYGTVTTILLVAWILVLLLVRPIPVGVPSWVASLLWAALGVGAGLAFRPLRRAVTVWADHRFFQIYHARDELLADLDRELTRADTASDLLRILHRHLGQVLRPRRLAVVARAGAELLFVGRRTEGEAEEGLRAWEASDGIRRGAMAVPGSTDQPDEESELFPHRLREGGFVLGVTLRTATSDGGVVLVGPRRTGRHFVRRELNLARDLVARSSSHLERIELARRVSEERAERRRLDVLNRAKSEFLSRVSHDLRTPLTSISWSVQNLLDGVVGEVSDEQREYLHEVGHSAAYLNRLVHNLLRMSRLERGELEASCARVDLRDVVRASLTTLGPVARARGVDIEPEVPAEPVLAWADPALLEEALVNLLENAVDFSPPSGSVDVTLEKGEDEARILVRDRGPGLPPGGGAALFERFSQGPPSPWASRQGFGLGLHIASVHLSLMGGALGAADAPGGGAVFTCSLRGDAPGPEGTP